MQLEILWSILVGLLVESSVTPPSGLLCCPWATYITLQKYIKELASESAQLKKTAAMHILDVST